MGINATLGITYIIVAAVSFFVAYLMLKRGSA